MFEGTTSQSGVGAQGPFTTRESHLHHAEAAQETNVDVHFIESSGCYGRLTADDAAEDAVLMSRAVGRPVRVQWMRADEQVSGAPKDRSNCR